MIPQRADNLAGAATGWQNAIKGTNANVPGTVSVNDLTGNGAVTTGAQTNLAGATLGVGTFYYYIPTAGCASLDVTLRMSAHTGTVPTITLYPVLSDSVSLKGTATSVSALSDGVQATTSLTTLRGEKGCLLKIVVPAASSATFDQADASCL